MKPAQTALQVMLRDPNFTRDSHGQSNQARFRRRIVSLPACPICPKTEVTLMIRPTAASAWKAIAC